MSNLPDENEKGINQTDSNELYGRIQSEQEKKEISGTIRTGDKSTNQTAGRVVLNTQVLNTIEERIAASTHEGGLTILPANFGKPEGDWKIIESTGNLFEMLYLDYHQHLYITPDIAKNNFNIINEYWKTQSENWGSSNARAKEELEKKFTKKTLEECLKRMTYAYQQLNNAQNIDEYYKRFRQEQIQKNEKILEPYFEFIAADNKADPDEIGRLFERGEALKLSIEETAQIVKKAIDARSLKPYKTPVGKLLSEQLLSVSWMTDDVIKQTKEEEEFKKRNGREILENILAYSTEDIGQIMFDYEQEIKQQIAQGLLKNSIDYFSPAKASQFLAIVSNQKNEHLRYLQAIYRLKPKLPYRFNTKNTVTSPGELCEKIVESPENFAAGKAQFKQGYIEVWLMETNKLAYQQLVSIRDKAPNADLAFLKFIYTFNPGLPYRFNNNILPVKTPLELCNAIDKDGKNWEAGKKELFDDSIIVWLATTGHNKITDEWSKIKNRFTSLQDVGLEHFLHLLNEILEAAEPEISLFEIKHPAIQSGQTIQTNITISNKSRGVLFALVQFSKIIPGVSLSAESILLNNTVGTKTTIITLTIDSTLLLKGVHYEASIVISPFEYQKIEIPVSFKIIFPKNAFWKRTIIYALIGAVFFALIRLVLSSAYPDWLNHTFNAFLDWDTAVNNENFFWLFGCTFFLFIAVLLSSIFFLTKYLKKK